jgi:hypothetical protein
MKPAIADLVSVTLIATTVIVALDILWTMAAVMILLRAPVVYSCVIYRQVRAAGDEDTAG